MPPRARRFAVSFALAGLIATSGALAALSLSTSMPITEAFDGIGTTATATLPADFKVDRLGTVRAVGSFAAALTATTQVGGANLSTTAANGWTNAALLDYDPWGGQPFGGGSPILTDLTDPAFDTTGCP